MHSLLQKRESATIFQELLLQLRLMIFSSRTCLIRYTEPAFIYTANALLAVLLLLLCAPLLLIRAYWNYQAVGHVFNTIDRLGQHCSHFKQWQFSQAGFAQNLPILFNIILGDMTFVGPRPLSIKEQAQLASYDLVRFEVKPGWFSSYDLRCHVGINYQSENEADREFVYTQAAIINAGLMLRILLSSLFKDKKQLDTPEQLHMLGINMKNTTMQAAIDGIMQHIQLNEQKTIAFANADCLNISYINPEYKDTLKNKVNYVLADGIGIRIGARLLKMNMRGNVNGTDLFPLLCEQLAQTQKSLYLLGARPQVAETVAKKMQAKFPDLCIAGTQDGYFSEAETPAIIDAINQSKADVLLVAFGAPKQELWLAQHREQLEVKVCMGVGGLFDFYSERIARAPQWMREIGLEWVWRFMQEPQRMWKRYLVGNPLFLYRVLKQALIEEKSRPTEKKEARLHSSYHWMKSFLGQFNVYWLNFLHVLNHQGNSAVKRLFDITVSGILLLLISPLLLAVIAIIKMTSEGDAFFGQFRIGKHGRPFKMWKFRSMYKDAERRKAELLAKNEMADGVLFKMKKDPRITPIGGFIRKFSIDELPQLWNVFIGDMSLVGPRPAIPSEVAQYTPYQRQRLGVVPGITCIWQVSGRSEIPFLQQVEMDIEYITTQSFTTDIILLIKTVPAVLKGKGAY